MASNPSPSRTSPALWDLWVRFDKLEPTAQYGGTYAVKPGYHNGRDAISSHDYSVEEVTADRTGNAHLASAIDLTMSAKAMVRYCKRMDSAMRAKDHRLFVGGVPILREFIGTLDNKKVYCYMLTGGRAQGVNGDSGVDWGRDKSHLWHMHLSIIRKFADSADAMERIYSILSGEAYTAWAKRHDIPVTARQMPTKPVTPAHPAALTTYRNGSRHLQHGMSGTDVLFVQKWIGKKRCGSPDGSYGDSTEAGVQWYQGMRGLKVTGVVDPHTWAAMGVH